MSTVPSGRRALREPSRIGAEVRDLLVAADEEAGAARRSSPCSIPASRAASAAPATASWSLRVIVRSVRRFANSRRVEVRRSRPRAACGATWRRSPDRADRAPPREQPLPRLLGPGAERRCTSPMPVTTTRATPSASDRRRAQPPRASVTTLPVDLHVAGAGARASSRRSFSSTVNSIWSPGCTKWRKPTRSAPARRHARVAAVGLEQRGGERAEAPEDEHPGEHREAREVAVEDRERVRHVADRRRALARLDAPATRSRVVQRELIQRLRRRIRAPRDERTPFVPPKAKRVHERGAHVQLPGRRSARSRGRASGRGCRG